MRIAALLLAFAHSLNAAEPLPPRQMEKLGRGVVAIHKGDGKVFVSWRLLGTDPEAVAFNLYRTSGDAAAVKVNAEPITKATCYQDTIPDLTKPTAYSVKPVIESREGEASTSFLIAANPPAKDYLGVPLKTPKGYTPNDCSVGDLDGDGEYEIVVHFTGRAKDNSQAGETDPPIFQAYKLDGTLLWEINLGRNVREGAHYTQFLVYDFDGDGRAELMCKTADGTTDGAGKVIGDATKDYRSEKGYILEGPEFLTVFDGKTGKALATTDYVPARGRVADWGDNYGNRVDRFLAGVAYLDGERPSAVFCRGYYTRTVLAAWDYREGKLTKRWVFDSGEAQRAYSGQGDHSLSVADVDGDGKDDVVYGAMCVGSNGKGLYSTGLGHGDALHCSAFDPARPGLQVFNIHEHTTERTKNTGASFRDAKTGEVIWSKPSPDVGRGLIADIDPRHAGAECWASGAGLSGLWNCAKGDTVSAKKPRSCNFAVWWDGDPLREILDKTTITKWNWKEEREETLLNATGCQSNNGTKSTPALSGDILGDWREEVILRSADNKELRIYTTTIPTDLRLFTLMHDPQYRLAIAWQNVGYNQPPHPSFHLGHGMKMPPRPNIATK